MGSRTLLFGTPAGLFEAKGNGGAYEARPLGLSGKGPVRAILVDKDDPKIIYAGTASRGLYRSDDAGKTWNEKNEGLVYKQIWSLAQHPKTGELWAGTEPANIFRSGDRGDTWSHCEQLQTLQETQFWTFPRPPHIAHTRTSRCAPTTPPGSTARSKKDGSSARPMAARPG